MALSEIIDEILNSAREKKEQILENAKQCAAEIAKNADTKIAEIEKNYAEKTEQKLKTSETKIENLISNEEKNILSNEKRKLVDEVFAAAARDFSQISENDLIELCAAAFAKIKQKSGQILPGRNFKKICERAAQKTGVNFKICDEQSFAGGFIFANESVEIDFSLPTIFEKIAKKKLELEIYENLFEN